MTRPKSKQEDTPVITEDFDRAFKRGITLYIRQRKAYTKELEESSPRAQIALAVSHFEEDLRQRIKDELGTFGHYDTIAVEELEAIEKMVAPWGVSRMIEVGYAARMFSYRNMTDLKKVVKLRNHAVHKAIPISRQEERKIGESLAFLEAMERFLMERFWHTSEDNDPAPAAPLLPWA